MINTFHSNAQAVDFVNLGVVTTQAQLFIPRQTLAPTQTYQVTLTVCCANKSSLISNLIIQ